MEEKHRILFRNKSINDMTKKESQMKLKIEKKLEAKYPSFRVPLADAADELGISIGSMYNRDDLPKFPYKRGKAVRVDLLAQAICDQMAISS